MKSRKTFWTSVLLLLMLTAGAGAQLWVKKPYSEWNKGDCKKMLADSPWVGTEGTIQPIQQTVSAETAEASGRESALEIKYVAQLRSALPIRQAVVRQAQLENKYDKMTPEKKAEFDKNAASFLNAEFPDHVLINVSYESNVPLRDRDLAIYWQKQANSDYQTKFALIGGGGRIVNPLKFEAAQGAGREFQVIFPRHVAGEPLIGPEDKELTLEFIAPEILSQRSRKFRIVYRVKDMIVDGKVLY